MFINAAEREGITLAVRNYVEAMTYADEERLRLVFHPASCIIGNFHGSLEWLSLDSFVAEVLAGGAAPDGAEPRWETLALDLTGDAASMKVAVDYLGMRFTDYLSLLKVEGRWVIINKLYHHHA